VTRFEVGIDRSIDRPHSSSVLQARVLETWDARHTARTMTNRIHSEVEEVDEVDDGDACASERLMNE